jgi:hypothetical protein
VSSVCVCVCVCVCEVCSDMVCVCNASSLREGARGVLWFRLTPLSSPGKLFISFAVFFFFFFFYFFFFFFFLFSFVVFFLF